MLDWPLALIGETIQRAVPEVFSFINYLLKPEIWLNFLAEVSNNKGLDAQ